MYQVERALQSWVSGAFEKPVPKFSQDAFGLRSRFYLRSVVDLRESTWENIVKAAEEYCYFDQSNAWLGELAAADDSAFISDEEDAAINESGSENDDGKFVTHSVTHLTHHSLLRAARYPRLRLL